jgi:hypothetical protein
MSHIRLLLAVASALALAACAPSASKSDLSNPSPPAPTATPAVISGAASAQSAGADFGANADGTYPYGQASGVQTSNAGSGRDDTTVSGPDGTIWLKPGAANETYRRDADSCYSFARAQNAHDARIESDSRAAFRDTTGGIGLVQLRQRMSQFARSNRMPRLFGKCMEAKGYSRG